MMPTATSAEESVSSQEALLGASGKGGLPLRIAASIRWTLWLSILALPSSYVTNVLLARLGPEALGTFGVLNVYIGIVCIFFFLGGCAVPMKFLPDLKPTYRASFLASYGLVIILSFVPWLVLLAWQPQLLHFFFGDAGTPGLQLQLIYLSPLCLFYLITITSLKAILEMKWAQILDRGITFGLTLVLVVLFLWKRLWLGHHAADVVWLTYIGLTFVVAGLAFYRLLSIGILAGRPRLWLPPGFWPYTLTLQTNSLLSVLSTRLDYILILNTGGLATLGQYVAITSMVGIIPRIAGFVVDSLLPALTNCLSADNMLATVRVAEVHCRMLFPVVLLLSLLLSLFVRPVLAIMGPDYLQFAGLLQIAYFGAAVQSLNSYNSTIFTATDRVRYGVIATLAKCAAFIGSFVPLWLHFRLTGAVVAWIIGESVYHGASLYLLRRRPVIKVPMVRTYFGCICVLPVAVLLGHQALQAQYLLGVTSLCLACIVFFTASGYTAHELRSLARLLVFAEGSPDFTETRGSRACVT